MVTHLVHPLSFNRSTMEACMTADRMMAKRSNWRKHSNGHLPVEVVGNFRSRPINFRLFSRKNSRSSRPVQVQGVVLTSRCCYPLTLSPLSIGVPSEANSIQDNNERCGCGARSQFFGQRISSRASRFTRSTTSLDGCDGTARVHRRKRKLVRFNHGVQAEKKQPWSLRSISRRQIGKNPRPFSWAGGLTEERDERREFATRAQSTFRFMERIGVDARIMEISPSFKSRFMSVAAAAGLSLTLCSSALANPITTDGPVRMPTTPVSESLRTYVETQLRRELQAQIKVQKDWLDEIGQPLSQWSIDDRVRKSLEEMSKSRLDESGKAVSKLEMLESDVVPIFKPPVVAPKKEKVAIAGIATSQEPSQAKVASASSQSLASVAVQPRESTTTNTPLTSKAAKSPLDGATELVAVAAIPLGSVVSAASRTVGSAASIVAIQASGTAVPGVSLFTRIMMHFGGGGVAGAMGATVVYPLDTIKTRMQAQITKDGEEAQFKDEWDCLRQLVAKEGPGSLYSGLLPQLIGIAPEKAMKLTVNEILMEMLECQMPGVGAWALELIAGGGGGFSQVVFTNPMEIVKVRLQTQSKDAKQKNTWDVIKELGVQGLYNGSTVTMARDIPSSAIFFAIYTLIRQVYPDQSFIAGFVAAIPATVLVTPFDVIKTRLQMERAVGEVPYENGYACFMMIMQKEGIGALFKGSLARVLKTSPQFGITLMLYSLFSGS